MIVEYFTLGGGGAGGGGIIEYPPVNTGPGTGGGGAGGLVIGTSADTPPGDYGVVVGAGGVYNPAPEGRSSDGGGSAIYGITPGWGLGGGAGGTLYYNQQSPSLGTGYNGGSGGGGTGTVPGYGATNPGGSGTGGQGYNGGPGYLDVFEASAGGGGGIGGPGTAPFINYQGGQYNVAGFGGPGIYSDFDGTSKPYAGGGAGGPGRYDGGGAGGGPPSPVGVWTTGGNSCGNGVNGTGGGGGGGGALYGGSAGSPAGPYGPGGNGGSGIVMVRYPTPYPPDAVLCSGGTIIDATNGYRVHTFLASSTLSIIAPTITAISVPSGFQGTTFYFQVAGTNFTSAGTSLSVGAGALPVSSFSVGASTWCQCYLTIPPNAVLGMYEVRVTNPAGQSAPVYFEVKSSGSGMFIVMPH
jgi:hypothetical protein